MIERPYRLAGNALLWKSVELVAAKVIFLLRLVILARLLSPEDFGLMAIAVTVIGFLLSLTNFGMVPALVQGAKVSEKWYNVAWTVQVGRALVVTAVVILFAPWIANLFNEPRAIAIIQVLALRPLFDGLASIKVARLNRDLQFRSLAFLGLTQAILNTVASIVLAPVYGVWALVAGTLAGSLVYLIVSYIVAPYRPRLSLEQAAARPLLRFGRWIFVTGLLAMAGSYVLRVTIARQLGTVELGLYYLATQIAFLPAEIAGQVIEPVAFPLFSRLQANLKQVAETFRLIFRGMAALLFPACILIIALAPSLVQDVLGPDWAGTAPVIRVLALAALVGLFGEVTGPLFKGLGQPYRLTIIEIGQSSLLIVFAWIFAGRMGLIGAAAAWLPAIFVSQIVNVIFMRRLLENPFAGIGLPLIAVGLASAAGGTATIALDRLLPGLLGFVLAAAAGVATSGLALWAFDSRFGLGLTDSLGKFFPQIQAIRDHLFPDKESVPSVHGP